MGISGSFFLYPGGDPDQDPSSHFFHEVLISSICVILLTDKQTNKWS